MKHLLLIITIVSLVLLGVMGPLNHDDSRQGTVAFRRRRNGALPSLGS